MAIYTLTEPSTSLLDQLELRGIRTAAQCREGFCGACRATVIDGSADYDSQPLACVDSNEVILCCAHSDYIQVEIHS